MTTVVDPWVIKRILFRLAATQMFVGAGVQFIYALGPLMVVALTGSAALAGVSIALHGASRFLAAYPFGRITDHYGRRPGLLLGLVIGLAGTLIVGVGMQAGSFAAFLVGLLVFGIGMNGVQQLRLAAAEMFPPHRRAAAVGYVLTGTLVGALLSPLAVAAAQYLAPIVNVNELALPWLFAPAFIIPAFFLVRSVRPDPRDISRDLARYHPDYVPNALDTGDAGDGLSLGRFLQDPHRRLAAVAMFSAQGSMQIAMVTAPLALAHHGAALSYVALAMGLHAGGMFGPSVPMGKLADAVGRRKVLIAGAAVEALGGGITAFATDTLLVTMGVTLVGFGWCAANVSSTALVVDATHHAVRGRAIGFVDSIAAVAGVATPLLVGPIVDRWGIGATGIFAIVLLVPPTLLLASSPIARRATFEPADPAAVAEQL